MKPGLLASIAGHGLIAALILWLVVPRQTEVPPEVAVELATGAPAPPPAPDAAKPAPEPQPPSVPSPPTEPLAPTPTDAAPVEPPATPQIELTPPQVAPTPIAPPTLIDQPAPPPVPPKLPAPPPTPPRPPVPQQQSAPPSAPPAVRLGEGITSTKVEDNPYNPDLGCKNLQNLGPAYPEGARRRGEAGDPKLRVHIDSSGQAFLVEILESSGFRALDDAARTSLRTWRCLPSTLDGKRVPDMFDIRIHFSLG